MNTYELSFTEFKSKEDLISKIDEQALQIDLLKIDKDNLQRESNFYQKLYHEAMKKAWTVGL